MRNIYVFLALSALVLLGCGGDPAGTETVIIEVTQAQLDVIKSLPSDVVCLTSAANPVSSLSGIADNEFASSVKNFHIPQKLMVAFGRKDTPVGLRIIPPLHPDADFNNNKKLKLLITSESFADQLINKGGVRITFKAQ